MDREIKKGIYRHFKGNEYRVIDIAKNSETNEDMVIYRALYNDYGLYVRPLDMFLSKVDTIKYPDIEQEYRFEYVGEDEDSSEYENID